MQSKDDAPMQCDLAPLYEALAAAQGEFLPIEKNQQGIRNGDLFWYADLDELTKKTRPALAVAGLCVMQLLRTTARGQELVTILAHKSGAAIEAAVTVGSYADIKDFGAAVTLLRRYAYQSILSLSAEDVLEGTGQTVLHPELNQPREESRAPQDREPEELPDERPFMDDEKFSKNMAAYRTAIKAGKQTPERVERMISTLERLTDAQREQLYSIKADESGQGGEE